MLMGCLTCFETMGQVQTRGHFFAPPQFRLVRHRVRAPEPRCELDDKQAKYDFCSCFALNGHTRLVERKASLFCVCAPSV